MTATSIKQYITDTFPGLDIVDAGDDSYFFYDPNKTLPVDRRHPFATIMTSDANDTASNLSRPGVFRLNIGVTKETYHAMFGPPPKQLGGMGGIDTGHDYSAIDRVMPHPVYAAMAWVCVVNPSDATFEQVRGLLKEAHELAAAAFAKRAM